MFFIAKQIPLWKLHSAVGENASEDEVCDEFGDEGDLTTSLELVTSDLETVGYEINTSIDSRCGIRHMAYPLFLYIFLTSLIVNFPSHFINLILAFFP